MEVLELYFDIFEWSYEIDCDSKCFVKKLYLPTDFLN